MLKFTSFLGDICPYLGGVKMCIEGVAGKEMSGTILVGNARTMHILFGIISFILDVLFVGIPGTLGRLIFRAFGRRSAVKTIGKVFGKGFIRKGTVLGAKAVGQGGTRAVLKTVATDVTKMEKKFLGRLALRSAERKIRRGVEHTASNIYGYRFDSKKRDEVRKEYGIDINNRKDLKEVENNLNETQTGKTPLYPEHESYRPTNTIKSQTGHPVTFKKPTSRNIFKKSPL